MDILKETPAQPASSVMLATEPMQRETVPSRPQRPKTKSHTTYDKALESLAYIASFCIAAALWYVGAYWPVANILQINNVCTFFTKSRAIHGCALPIGALIGNAEAHLLAIIADKVLTIPLLHATLALPIIS